MMFDQSFGSGNKWNNLHGKLLQKPSAAESVFLPLYYNTHAHAHAEVQTETQIHAKTDKILHKSIRYRCIQKLDIYTKGGGAHA